MVAQLKALKVRTVILTGDNENSAHYVAAQTGLDDFKAGCSPEDKMNYIKNQEAQENKVATILLPCVQPLQELPWAESAATLQSKVPTQ